MVRGLLGLGHGLGLIVTAEGVEQPAQAAALLEQGFEQGQGFLYSRAISAADAIKFMAMRKTDSAGSNAHAA